MAPKQVSASGRERIEEKLNLLSGLMAAFIVENQSQILKLKQALPEDKWELANSKSPLDDYAQEEWQIPDEGLLLLLASVQMQRDPKFTLKLKTTETKRFYVAYRNDVATHVYEVLKRTVDVDTAKSFLMTVQLHGTASEYVGFDLEQSFNDNFWASPAPVYHGTPNVEEVLRLGIEARSETRGMTNRSVGAAVFTSMEPEETTSYGDTVVVNTKAMKADGLTPFVFQEPKIVEDEYLSSLFHLLGMEYEPEADSDGVSPNTVIFNGSIPAKYLSELK